MSPLARRNPRRRLEIVSREVGHGQVEARCEVLGSTGPLRSRSFRTVLSPPSVLLGEAREPAGGIVADQTLLRWWAGLVVRQELRSYRFAARGSYAALLPAALATPDVVTPAGFEPAISTLKGSRPWPG